MGASDSERTSGAGSLMIIDSAVVDLFLITRLLLRDFTRLC